MTAQLPDQLTYRDRTHALAQCPFLDYVESAVARPQAEGSFTALWRGWLAHWEVVDDQLWLAHLDDPASLFQREDDPPVEPRLQKVFPGQRRVLADWYTGGLEPAPRQNADGQPEPGPTTGFQLVVHRGYIVREDLLDDNGSARETRLTPHAARLLDDSLLTRLVSDAVARPADAAPVDVLADWLAERAHAAAPSMRLEARRRAREGAVKPGEWEVPSAAGMSEASWLIERLLACPPALAMPVGRRAPHRPAPCDGCSIDVCHRPTAGTEEAQDVALALPGPVLAVLGARADLSRFALDQLAHPSAPLTDVEAAAAHFEQTRRHGCRGAIAATLALDTGALAVKADALALVVWTPGGAQFVGETEQRTYDGQRFREATPVEARVPPAGLVLVIPTLASIKPSRRPRVIHTLERALRPLGFPRAEVASEAALAAVAEHVGPEQEITVLAVRRDGAS